MTNKVPVTILHVYIPIPLHICKGVLIWRIIALRLCTVASNTGLQ